MMKNNEKLKDLFIIKYQPFTVCNYHCSYCCEKYKKKGLNLSDRLQIYQSIKKIKEKIIKKIDENIMIAMSGGEISLLNIDDFINNILEVLKDEKIKYIYIVSNFSRPAKYYNKINDWCKKNNITFLLEASFHEEFISEEDFFNKIEKLNFELLQIQTVVTEKNFSFMKKIKEKHPEVFFEPNIYDEISKIDFSFSEKELQRYSLRKQNAFFGKSCLQNQLVIKENGDIYNNNCKSIYYGNLNSNICIPKKIFITCKKENCPGTYI